MPRYTAKMIVTYVDNVFFENADSPEEAEANFRKWADKKLDGLQGINAKNVSYVIEDIKEMEEK